MDAKTCRRNDPPDTAHKTSSGGGEFMISSENLERKRTVMKLDYNCKDEKEELPRKKPRLTVDTSPNCQPLCEALSSNESFISGVENEAVPTMASSLSAYLEDIVSDEELLDATPPCDRSKTPPFISPVSSRSTVSLNPVRSKEELLQMMERVDREITSIEQQISVLEERQEETSCQTTTPISTAAPAASLPSVTTSSFISSSISDHSSFPMSSSGHHRSTQRSTLETIYRENRLLALNNHVALFGNDKLRGVTPSYYQPSEITQVARIRERHRSFFPKLVSYLKKKKIEQHQHELNLCKEYSRYSREWEKRIERWTQSIKKKKMDSRNKELFEKVFPELRSKRDQLRDEAYSRVGMRSFGVVRSEAELNQLAYELFEQDEARGRCRKTHALLPPMMIDDRERRSRFINTNGLISDPMSLHRETKTVHSWTEEEKAIFKEKFVMFPKNFEKIASFLPHKSMNECVRYYYLVKKKERFKQLIRRSSFKRRRLNKHHSDYPLNTAAAAAMLAAGGGAKTKPRLSSSDGGHSSAPPSILTSPTVVFSPSLPTVKSPPVHRLQEYDGWSEKEIASLKEGLCKYGRAWGKVYREVGGRKSATQCKQFYDMYCTDPNLMLNNALAEHSSIKNAEKVKKKMAELKKSLPQSPAPSPSTKKPERKPHPLPPAPPEEEEEDGESEESEASESDEGSDEEGEGSDSETTLTDSGGEENHRHTPKPLRLSIDSGPHNSDSLQSPLDIFLSAAEALSNTVPVEIALHDHTYSRPPMDLQGSSGLQLIAAAAAVVSPGLSRTASTSNKSAFSSLSATNKAPRGRPPSQQKRGGGYSQKLAPTFLTPTSGVNQSILLQDLKPSLRARSRSAPTEKMRPSVPVPNKPILPYSHPVKGTSRLSVGGAGCRSNSVGNNVIASGIFKTNSSVSNGHAPLDAIGQNTGTLSDGSARAVTSSVLTYPLVNSTGTSGGGTKAHRKDGGTVLELNLGSMALLLAATGNNQQAALLLPQSTLLNKQTLAVLQGSSGATINIDPSVFTTSNGRSTKTDTKDSHPLTVNKAVSTEISSKDSALHVSVKDINRSSVGNGAIPLSTIAAAATTAHTNNIPVMAVQAKKATRDPFPASQEMTGGVTTPTSSDLSNLNLLSNLVADLPKKSDSVLLQSTQPVVATPPTQSTSLTVTATPPAKPTLLNFRKAPEEKSDTCLMKPEAPIHRGAVQPASSSYPTISSQQQSLMLYARSLTMPLNSSSNSSPEEVDHLEYATRGISELSKLLGGTDNGLETPPPHPAKMPWSPDDLLCNPFSEKAPPTTVHTITSSLTATSSVTDLLAPPTHQIPLSNRTPTPINALTEDNS